MTAISRTDLPIDDYDHLNVGTLAGRIRSLDAEELGQVLAFEESHGRRMPVLMVLRRRLAELKAGAPLSPGSRGAAVADTTAATADDDTADGDASASA